MALKFQLHACLAVDKKKVELLYRTVLGLSFFPMYFLW